MQDERNIEEPKLFNLQQEGRQVTIDFSFSTEIPLDKCTVTVHLFAHDKENLLLTAVPSSYKIALGQKYIPLSETIKIFYLFEVRQKLRVVLNDRQTKELVCQSSSATVGQIYSMKRFGFITKMKKKGKDVGNIRFGCEEEKDGEQISIEFKVANVQSQCSMLCFCPMPIYYRIYKRINQNVRIIHQGRQPVSPTGHTFPRIKVSMQKLCNSNHNQPFFIEFLNHKINTSIGQAQLTTSDLLKGQKKFVIKGKKGEQKGKLQIINYVQGHIYHAIDFVSNGMQYALQIGIDFTLSNHHYQKKESLHYFDQRTKSCYEKALEETVQIVLDYDYDKLVPLYGFGAKVRMDSFNSGQLKSNYFPLNGSFQNPSVASLEQIVSTYRNVMPFLSFSGPSLMAPIISQSVKQAKEMKKEGREYMILLLLTDGDITDGDEVIDLVVECGRLPISIIVIGITNEEEESWQFMHMINDNNRELIDSHGRRSERDMVTFVQYKKYAHSPVKLAEQVLQELPRQVVEYHSLERIKPEAYNKFLGDREKAHQQSIQRLMNDLESQVRRTHNYVKQPNDLDQSNVKIAIREEEHEDDDDLRQQIGQSMVNLYLPEESNFRH